MIQKGKGELGGQHCHFGQSHTSMKNKQGCQFKM